MKKDLVQELRREAEGPIRTCSSLLRMFGETCESIGNCDRCIEYTFNTLADRIEAEYDPKPEPDTVEKVALDMYGALHEVSYYVAEFKGKNFCTTVEEYRKSLEALGVKVDG